MGNFRNKLKTAISFLKDSDIEMKRMAILKTSLFSLCQFAELKGINNSKDKTIRELKDWSGKLFKNIGSGLTTMYGNKTESRIERFKYYLYYKDLLEQLYKLGIKSYIINKKKEYVKNEIEGVNKILNNPNDY